MLALRGVSFTLRFRRERDSAARERLAHQAWGQRAYDDYLPQHGHPVGGGPKLMVFADSRIDF